MAGLSHQDVALLNRSIENLGNTFGRNRDRAAAQQSDQARLGLQSQMHQDRMGLERENMDLRRQEGQADIAAKQKEIANRVWNDTVEMHVKWVKDGVMPAEQAVASLKGVAGKLPQEQAALLEGNPAWSMVQDEGFSLQDPQKPEKDAEEVEIGGRKFAQTANGALIPLDKEPSRPFSRSYPDPTDPEGKVTERMTREEYEAWKKSQTNPDRKKFNPKTGKFE